MIPPDEIRKRLAGYRPGSLDANLTADDYGQQLEGLKPASVLIPIIAHDDEPTLLMTVRNARMKRHAGQVAFPGGRTDPGETAVEAALREAEEEVALSRDAVEVIGELDEYATGTGYRITPIVGIISPGQRLLANEAEVSDIFELPLNRALDGQFHIADEAEWGGVMRQYYRVDWGPQNVWGATAGIIVNFARILAALK
ncbi:CoA pyrophosphatase [Pacificimonas sp. WHA3]|uniref:CoA pyrophosphatase n=1 Tax=Pacificimonas pallii TaxID=2827236 RepID=A0ABS6SFA0_9SPHN|nr:CoA pyrophosphatase [Pacificimonas pallii]MBV7257079.1 CoA pyrophosphatase [Pacificimonas pallii]